MTRKNEGFVKKMFKDFYVILTGFTRPPSQLRSEFQRMKEEIHQSDDNSGSPAGSFILGCVILPSLVGGLESLFLPEVDLDSVPVYPFDYGIYYVMLFLIIIPLLLSKILKLTLDDENNRIDQRELHILLYMMSGPFFLIAILLDIAYPVVRYFYLSGFLPAYFLYDAGWYEVLRWLIYGSVPVAMYTIYQGLQAKCPEIKGSGERIMVIVTVPICDALFHDSITSAVINFFSSSQF